MHVSWLRNTGSLAALPREAGGVAREPHGEEKRTEVWRSGQSTSQGTKKDFTPVVANCLGLS